MACHGGVSYGKSAADDCRNSLWAAVAKVQSSELKFLVKFSRAIKSPKILNIPGLLGFGLRQDRQEKHSVTIANLPKGKYII